MSCNIGILWYFINLVKVVDSKLPTVYSYIGAKPNPALILAKKAH